MDSLVKIYLGRADNEVLTADSLKRLSGDQGDKERFSLPSDTTFYSAVISHSYYAIFYASKALLLTIGVKTSFPGVPS